MIGVALFSVMHSVLRASPLTLLAKTQGDMLVVLGKGRRSVDPLLDAKVCPELELIPIVLVSGVIPVNHGLLGQQSLP